VQVNYFPSRFDPVRHAERTPLPQNRISGVRDKVIHSPMYCWVLGLFETDVKAGGTALVKSQIMHHVS
jgi:hypothetical protein